MYIYLNIYTCNTHRAKMATFCHTCRACPPRHVSAGSWKLVRHVVGSHRRLRRTCHAHAIRRAAKVHRRAQTVGRKTAPSWRDGAGRTWDAQRAWAIVIFLCRRYVIPSVSPNSTPPTMSHVTKHDHTGQVHGQMRRVPSLGAASHVDDESGLNKQLPSLGITKGPAALSVEENI